MKRTLLLLPLFLLLFSTCTEQITEYVLKVKPQPFDVDQLYSSDAVADYLFDTEEMDVDSLKDLSRAEFLKGVDLYRNKKKPWESITCFKNSIKIFPDAKTYYELGNALLEFTSNKDNLNEAIQAFKVAERLNFQPKHKVYYNQACAYNLLYNMEYPDGEENEQYSSNYSTSSSLRDAFLNGLSDTAMVTADPRLKSFTAKKAFRYLIADINAQKVKTGENGLFTVFKDAFPDLKGDFVMDYKSVDMVKYDESISYDFATFIPEMENTEFGRDVSHDYFYVGKLEETPEYVALIYSSISFWGGEMQPVHTILATYSPAGKLISRKMIACQCTAEKIKVASIEKGKIKVEEISRVWAQPIDEVPFDKNRIKAHDVTATASFAINTSGKIEDVQVPKEFNDSTLIVKQ